jgi:RNA-binding protein YlmH
LFLDAKEFKQVTSILKKSNYKIYYPYEDSEKVILYTNEIPKISLIKIISYNKLKHQEILGSILGLNISSSYLGDIIIDEDNYYFYIFDELKDFILNNLIMIGNNSVKLEEIDFNYLSNYKRKYEENKIIVSSLRIDNVISKIIKTNRDKVIDKIKNKEIILNYEIVNKNSIILKENDIFSIRRYGKYKFIGIEKSTKKANYIIKYLKYI